MSSEEMGTKGKKKLPKSKRRNRHKNKTAPVQQVLFYKGGIK